LFLFSLFVVVVVVVALTEGKARVLFGVVCLRSAFAFGKVSVLVREDWFCFMTLHYGGASY